MTNYQGSYPFAYGMLEAAIERAIDDLCNWPDVVTPREVAQALRNALTRSQAVLNPPVCGPPEPLGTDRWTKARGVHGAGAVYPATRSGT